MRQEIHKSYAEVCVSHKMFAQGGKKTLGGGIE